MPRERGQQSRAQRAGRRRLADGSAGTHARLSGAQAHERATMTAAESQPLAVAHRDLVVPALERSQFANAAPIDDDRTVDADELFCLELLLELAQRLAIEISLAGRVELHVVAARAQPLHVGELDD